MKKAYIYTFIAVCCLCGINASAQSACDALYKKGTPCYDACKKYESGVWDIQYRQGSRMSQMSCDSAIAACPNFAPVYYVKATPYLKRGEYLQWKQIIDRAVEYAPETYLGYRGGARFLFLRDYQGAIADIEKFAALKKGADIGFTDNGGYHLNVVLALCYSALGDKEKAIGIMENQLYRSGSVGQYDYLHLGVMQLSVGKADEAINTLNKQLKSNDCLADAHFYIAMAYKMKGNKPNAIANLKKARTYYMSGKSLPGIYVDYPDKIYLQQIDGELSLLS